MPVTVTAYARLHLGFLNLCEELGWVYGSLGVGLDAPRTRVVATPAQGLHATGQHADRIIRYAEHLAAVFQRSWQARLTVTEAIPEHSGLGSGTQWALTVGTALLRLHGIQTGPRELAGIMGRGMRSGIGVASFESGGIILEAGHKKRPPGEPMRPSEIILRRDFPAGWRFVLVIAEAPPGLSGAAEHNAFASLGESRAITDRLCRIVQLQLLPALVEEDIVAFGFAVSEIDRQTGLLFSAAQGGVYGNLASDIIDCLADAGAYGIGQSSWGPCLYALVDDANEAAVLTAARGFLARRSKPGQVFVARARNAGADILVTEEGGSPPVP